MDNKSINFSISASCSYAWHKNRFQHKSAAVILLKCVKALVCSVFFCNREVKLSEVRKIYTDKERNTIFGREYTKYISNIPGRTANAEHSTHTVRPIPDESNITKITYHNDDPTLNELLNKLTSTPTTQSFHISANDFMKYINILSKNINYNKILFIVTGDVAFLGKSTLKGFNLPTHLTIKGSLDLRGNINVKHLSENISVTGSIIFSDCSNLRTLPKSLHRIAGNILLRHCTSLSNLLDTMTAIGYIDLSGCTSIIEAPSRMEADEFIDFSGCTNLKTPPMMLLVPNIRFRDCINLNRLPMQLYIDAYLDCTNCPKIPMLCPEIFQRNLIEIVTKLTIPDKFSTSKISSYNTHDTVSDEDSDTESFVDSDSVCDCDCPQLFAYLTSLSKMENFCILATDFMKHIEVLSKNSNYHNVKFIVNGNVSFTGDSDLKRFDLPSYLKIEGTIDLRGNINVTKLPKELIVQSALLSNCVNLKSIPDSLGDVMVTIDLSNCIFLTDLPKTMKAGMTINCSGCVNIKTPPETMITENGHINFNGCTKLSKLPEWLQAGGSAIFSACPNIKNKQRPKTYLKVNHLIID